jgi:hypothetical protein
MANPKGTARARVVVEGEDKAAKDLKQVEKAWDDLAKGTSGVNKQLRAMSPQMGAVLAGLGAIAAAATAAAVAAKELGEQLVKLGMRGGEVDAVADAFERLADPGMLSNLQRVTGGLISGFELMARSTQALRTNLVSAEEFERWAAVVTRSAQDMGRDVSASFEAVTTTLAGGGLESLNRLGVNVPIIRDRLMALGKTAESMEGRTIAMRLAILQLNEELGDADNSSGNLNDAWTALSVTFRDFYDEVAREFATNERLLSFFVTLRGDIEAALPPVDEMAESLAQFAGDALVAIRDITLAVVDFTEAILHMYQVLLELDSFVGQFNLLGRAMDAVAGRESSSADAAAGVGRLRVQLQRLRGGLEEATDGVEELTESQQGLAVSSEEVYSGLGDAFAQLDTEFGRGIQALGEWTGLMVTAETEVNDLTTAQQAAARATEEATRRINQEAQALRDLGQAVDDSGIDFVAQAIAEGGGAAGATTSESFLASRRQQREAAAGAGRGGGGRGRRFDQLSEGALQTERMFADIQASATASQELLSVLGDIEETQGIIVETGREQQEIFAENVRTEIEAKESLIELEQQHADAQRERMEAFAEALQEQKDAEEAADKARVDRMNSAVGGMRSMVGSMNGMSQQILGLMEAQGKGAEETARAQGKYLVAYNTVMAIVEAAAAAASFASQQYVAGATHLIAAATYGVAAAAASSKLGGGSAGAAPLKHTGQVRETRSDNIEDDIPNQGGRTVVNNIYSLGRDRETMARGMDEARKEQQRSGVGSGNLLGVQYV